ncbi:hypothetical protein BD324DRAFT_195844 [Kockovaella imperatae]|uniref:BHLH domain-containing protein n=1 Tax=Kockovaella imperatae TaxID=4999 RepID=A0A1Y1U965_9TREE|nr:hypothetical protein BD324DRAFT_195844 [Kockovaella imperatae]ORX34084.1 hypothetical protein BD324DRAFT_195844 [Kockovaella imperatae]
MPVEDTFKRQKRRECHNQVEKRRREHINGKIEELGKLLPARYAEEAAQAEEDEEENRGSSKKKKKRPNPNTKQPRDAAQCKGRILSQSVKYIYELQHIQDMQNARIRQLESILASSGQIAPSAPPQYQHYIWNQPTHSTPIRRDSVAASPLAPAPTYFQPYPGMPRPMMHHIPKTTEDHHLEVMQPSPDPDATTRSNNSSWSGGNIHPASLTTSTSTSFSEGSGPHHIYSPEDAGLISGSSGSSPEQHLAHMVQKTGPTNQQPTEGLGLEVGLGPLDIEGHTVCWQN